ncbi:UDP-N-acetylmuramoyl-tripeptide--D-alanyl-D-alanine ligase [Duganella sp. BJB488]|uniref:UDP-N-acetylmuramoyl-tripeptide--D-alanyl-D- alanine ligase n=1 Tax=unclassified Duganella TaxID=2636909 RepID=UPI000E350EC2|nr:MULTISPECIES: UDP-N-acetylmuramoyl-tripeptide--D-alanyl-D-alanine ligase [unclassified Duganella]RFP22932.1 UDP-N-acetylmuramoyl-tripeptide--D-alanyl-D-alanine ligase [Duganella sp. BJB489]RFP24992.1 UDP-N-acetylmuramoyl-tripeptide--D-alanyl-D-alanine ligase [Duganella sp. BJB488]RFP33931.1 UDP-N-acetylmuramoyl-tripeptide--D-alanyl-D-alanine ligase [Duganella sp. BJB480]
MRAALAQILPSVTGAELIGSGEVVFSGVSTDSRNVFAGSLFVALRGEVFDAHDFLAQVAEKGAAAVVVEELPEGWTLPAIVVPNTLVALGQIANHWRRQFSMPVIGVTGSNGKTTVKEMIAAILAAAHGEEGRLATRGNLNNEIGVPLTLFRMEAKQQSAVVELGMNHPGEIGRLSAIAAPTIAMVNNAQREHQEFMHTVEAVARENGAVLAGLPADGVAVFPHGDEFTPVWEELSAGRRVLRFGLTKDAEVSCTFRANDFGNEMFVTIREGEGEPEQFFVNLRAAGDHNVRNALAAVACTWAAGIALEKIKLGLDTFAPVNGRLQKKAAANGAVVIDDSYNANPDSVRAAIDVLSKAAAPRVLVLGDMGEVGTQGREFHEEIGAYAQSKGIEQVLVTGELAAHMKGASIRHFENFGDLLAAVEAAVTPDATVLIKGSRFMKMERVVQHLIGSQQANKESH